MRRTPLGELPTRRQDLPAWCAGALGATGGIGSTWLAVFNARRPDVSWPRECCVVTPFGSRLGSPPVLASPGSLTPPPFAFVPARPTGTVFVTALRAEERPACPTTCQMTVAPGPQGLGALSFLGGA
jgi:hypothetical protein